MRLPTLSLSNWDWKGSDSAEMSFLQLKIMNMDGVQPKWMAGWFKWDFMDKQKEIPIKC